MKPQITEQDYQSAAELLKCSVNAIKAVASVESRGNGFLPDGRCVILYEPFVFGRETKGRFVNAYYKQYPLCLTGKWDRKKAMYAGGVTEYEKLNTAKILDEYSALKSCSYGKFQVMGFNYKTVGYDNIHDFYNAMQESESNHLKAFCKFILACRLADELRVDESDKADRMKKWYRFQQVYNGGGNPAYALKIEAEYLKLNKS